jgi:hypothetical protein
MTELIWDAMGTRFMEHGLDHGVLYPNVGPGVPWNGLTGVSNKSTGGPPEEYYFDGVKYVTVPQREEFAATLEAFTYPDEFASCEGVSTDGNGLFFDQQNREQFGLSYRTLRGNDQDQEVGYKLHLVYNAQASPTNRPYTTNSDSPDPLKFSWDLTTTPIKITGYRPTAHIVVDSTKMDPNLIKYLEGMIYGSPGNDAYLPIMDDVIAFVKNFDPRIVISDIFEGLSPLIPGIGDVTGSGVEGIFTDLPNTHLKESAQDGLYTLEG